MKYIGNTREILFGDSNETKALLKYAENDFNPTNRKENIFRESECNNHDEYLIYKAKESYEDISKYNGPEFGNEATSFIERKIDEILIFAKRKDLIGKVRVVILNRSDELRAFAMPDKTIVLTQRLINELQHLDTLMGIVIHELTHIINDDFKEFFSISKRFTQEKIADSTTPTYLDKLELNSTGLLLASMIIEKSIKNPSKKSLIYSELPQRQIELETQHRVFHRENSTKELTPLDHTLIKEYRPTNEEIYKSLKEKKDLASIRELLPLLSHEKLMFFYNRISIPSEGKALANEFHKLFENRLIENGFTKNQAIYSLFCLFQKFSLNNEEILNIVKNIRNVEDIKESENEGRRIFIEDTYSKSYKILLNVDPPYPKGTNHFLYHLRISLINEEVSFTLKSLIEIMKTYHQHITHFKSKEGDLTEIEGTLTYFFNNRVKSEIEINNFLVTIKKSGIEFKFDDKLVNALSDRLDSKCKDYLILKIEELFGFKYIRKIPVYEKTVEDLSISAFESKLNELAKKNINVIKEQLLYEFHKEYMKFFEGKSEGDKEKYLEVFLKFIDNLPLDKKSFYNNEEDCYLVEYIKYGQDFSTENLPELNVQYMQNVKLLASFNLKLSYTLLFFNNDTEKFYQKINEYMIDLPIKVEDLTDSGFYRLLSPLLNIDSNCLVKESILFGLGGLKSIETRLFYDEEVKHVEMNAFETSHTFISRCSTYFERIDLLEKTVLFQRYLNSREEKYSNNSSLEDIYQKYCQLASDYEKCEKRVLSSDKDIKNVNIFTDNFFNTLIFEKVRKEFLNYLKSTPKEKINSTFLYSFVKSFLPEGLKKEQLLREIQIDYIYGKERFENKVEFLEKNYQDFTYQDVVSLVEQIKVENDEPGEFWHQWNLIKEVYEKIKSNYETGKEKSIKIPIIDNVASLIGKNFNDFIIESTKSNSNNSLKLSTKLATEWSRINFKRKNSKNESKRDEHALSCYVPESKKFIASTLYRENFLSLKDTIEKLKNLSFLTKSNLLFKSLIAEGGLLSTSEKRKEFGKTITEALNLNNRFIETFIKEFTKNALPGTEPRNQLITLIPFLLSKKLFSALDYKLIDLDEVRKYGFIGTLTSKSLKDEVTDSDLTNIFRSNSRDLLAFGIQFNNVNSKLIAPLIRDSDETYYQTIEILEKIYPAREESITNTNKNELVSENIEILINLLEQSVLGVRGMQIASQLRNFESEGLRERMGKSFDANPGMDKLKFLLALDSAAELDSKLLEFLKTKLVRINNILGGGSMASTYSADAIDDLRTRFVSKKAIRGLIPGAELEIKKLGNSIIEVLNKMKENGFESNDSKLMLMVTRLSMGWCISDITDSSYEENDDIFRRNVIEEFNKYKSNSLFVAPERTLTSKKNFVRVEEMAIGVSVREFLDNEKVPSSQKKEVIKQIYLFNRFQFSQKNIRHNKALVQSDPSIGNYLIRYENEKPIISVLDRGFMLEISKERINLIEILFKGNYKEFLNQFVMEVIESNLESKDRFKNLSGVLKKVVKKNLEIAIISKFFLKYTFGSKVTKENLIVLINEIMLDHKLEIPLELQLIIKNIIGLEKLMLKYQGEIDRKAN